MCRFSLNIFIGPEDRTDKAILYKLGQSHQNVISHYALPMVYLDQYGLNLCIGSEERVP